MKQLEIPIPAPERLAALVAAHAPACWLDSALSDHPRHRFSVVALAPLQVFSADSLAAWPVLPAYPSLADPHLPFSGGYLGFVTYEAGIPPLPRFHRRKTEGLPGCFFLFVDSGLVIDHRKNSAYLFSLGLREAGGSCEPDLAEARCQELLRLLESVSIPAAIPTSAPAVTSNFSREEYLRRVGEIREGIFRGDCYQVNLSQKFSARGAWDPAALYLRLREVSPAPQMAFINGGDFQILSASPETLLEIEGDRVRSFPIKGTRPRADEPRADRAAAEALLASEKDAAELLMIVDLVRNDLGKFCRTGSISVPALKTLESFSQVHHLVAAVEGRLAPGKTPWDALRELSPGGSITGAPKLKAMEFIQTLEPQARGIYTGSIGVVGLDGRAAFNIAIRTAVLRGGLLEFSAGGGIVADSDPEQEYEETLHKARGFFEALGMKSIG